MTTTAEDEQTARAIVPDGLGAGGRCVALLANATTDAYCANLVSDGIDSDAPVGTRQLVIDTTCGQLPSMSSFDPYVLAARHLTDLTLTTLFGGSPLRILVDMP
jgi:hypothetical protein